MIIFDEIAENFRKEIDNKETDKMLNAIHRQAHYRRLEEENKRMLVNMARQERIAKKQERKEEIKDRIRTELETALLLILSTPLFIMILFMMS